MVLIKQRTNFTGTHINGPWQYAEVYKAKA